MRNLVAVMWLSMLPGAAFAQLIALDDPESLILHKVESAIVTYNGRSALRVVEAEEHRDSTPDKFVIVRGLEFGNGSIEVDVAGMPLAGAQAGARGFIGIVFRVSSNAEVYECFYIRPTNGRAEDQLRRNHSAQYVSYPDYPWQRLRESAPGMYESYVDLVPGEWTQLRIEISGTTARLFVHGAEQPTLIVNDLKLGETSGAIGLRIGPGTEGHFSNLRVTPE